jgi:hypothetical protein
MVVAERWRRLEVTVALAGLVTLPACSGDSDHLVDHLSRMDATSPPADVAAASATAPAVQDAALDALDALDATDARAPGDATVADADATDADAADAPLALDESDADAALPLNDICHVVWPQPHGLVVANGLAVATDPQGNAYIAVSYSGESSTGSSSTIDFGVPRSSSYPVGVALVKVDPACQLLWMREIGGYGDTSVQNGQIVVDGQSNVTLMGGFQGTVDFDGTMLASPAGPGTPSVSFPYVMRFDASGNVVYTKVFGPTGTDQEVSAGVVRVGDDGTSTIVVAYWNLDAYFGINDAGGPILEQQFLQLDPTGAVVSQTPRPVAGPFFESLIADPDGGLWALQGQSNGSYSLSAPILAHLSRDGTVDWTQSIDASAPNPRLAAGASNVVLLGAGDVTETLSSYTPTGAQAWMQTTEVGYAGGMFAERLAIDPSGAPIVGGEFFSATPAPVDGSTSTDPPQSGMGFQVFDSTGHFRSLKTWTGAPADVSGFGDVAVDPQGNVLLLGTTGMGQDRSAVFLAKLAQ